jgi:hypothetical protein
MLLVVVGIREFAVIATLCAPVVTPCELPEKRS